MIYLDSHIVVWLYAGLTDKLSHLAQELINEHELFISPIIRIELQYLYEIGRITEKPDLIISDLFELLELKLCPKDFNTIVSQSLEINWTRDPFDRLIVSHAQVNNNILITKDKVILANYDHAIWT